MSVLSKSQPTQGRRVRDGEVIMHALISVVRAMCLTNRLWVGWGKVSSTHHDVLRVRRICSSSDASGRDRVYRGAWDVRSDDRSCDESHARTSVTCPPLAPLSRPGKRLLDRPRFFAWDVTPRAGAVPKRHCLSGPHVNNVGADPPLGQPTPPARSPARGRSLGRRGARRTARPAARRQTAPGLGAAAAQAARPLGLRVEGLQVRFGDFVAVEGLDLDIAPGESFGIVGESGSGKSTVLRAVCGL